MVFCEEIEDLCYSFKLFFMGKSWVKLVPCGILITANIFLWDGWSKIPCKITSSKTNGITREVTTSFTQINLMKLQREMKGCGKSTGWFRPEKYQPTDFSHAKNRFFRQDLSRFMGVDPQQFVQLIISCQNAAYLRFPVGFSHHFSWPSVCFTGIPQALLGFVRRWSCADMISIFYISSGQMK